MENSRNHTTPSPLFAEPPIYPDLVAGVSPEMAGIPMMSYTSRYTDELALDRFQERMGKLRVTEQKATGSIIPSIEHPKTFQLQQSPPDRTYPLSRHTSLDSIEILSISSSHYEDGMEGVDERPLSPLPPYQVQAPSAADPQDPVPQLSITEWKSPSGDYYQFPITPPRVFILNSVGRDGGTSPLLPLNSEPLQQLLTAESEIFPRSEPVPQLFSPPRILSNMQSPEAPLEINSILISEDSLAQETDPNRTLTPQRTPQSLSKSFGPRGLSRTDDLARMDTVGYRHVRDVHQEIFAPLTRGVSHKSPYSAPVVPKSASKNLVRTPSKHLKSPGKLQRSGNKKDRVQFSQSTNIREQIREFGKEIIRDEGDTTVTSLNGTVLQVDEKGIEAEKIAESRNASVRRDILRHMYRQYMKDIKQSHRESKREKTKSQRDTNLGEKLFDLAQHSSKQDSTTESEESEYHPPQTRVIRTDEDMFPIIRREFPYMELSPTASRRLWNKQMHQIESLTRSAQPTQTKQYRDLLEAEKRQIATIDVLNKDLQHARRLRDMQLKAQSEQLMKSQLREQRTAQAKSKQYYREYELRMKSRLQKKRTKEEVAFQKIFEDALDIQKERVRELKHFAREQQAVHMQAEKDSLQSMENYYKDRFSMLTDRISKETRDETNRKRNETMAAKRMRREVRQKLETEIQQLQDHIDDVENDTHFRELDALKFRENLRAATFLAPIK